MGNQSYGELSGPFYGQIIERLDGVDGVWVTIWDSENKKTRFFRSDTRENFLITALVRISYSRELAGEAARLKYIAKLPVGLEPATPPKRRFLPSKTPDLDKEYLLHPGQAVVPNGA